MKFWITFLISIPVWFVILLVSLNLTVGTYSRRIISERDAEIAAEEAARVAEDAAKYNMVPTSSEPTPPPSTSSEPTPPPSTSSEPTPPPSTSSEPTPPHSKYYPKLQCHTQDGIQYCSFPSDSLPVNGKMSQND